MAETLTAAGLALCAALNLSGSMCQFFNLGMKTTPVSVLDSNWKLLWRIPADVPPQHRFDRAISCPDEAQDGHCKGHPDEECVAIATYDIFNGTKGTSRLCRKIETPTS